ncbi:MAG: hypothetical protein SH850_11860 [Planctomycetaceae bacterium]|nr:hypothetical protein [Planctomycetaceae bacterium]
MPKIGTKVKRQVPPALTDEEIAAEFVARLEHFVDFSDWKRSRAGNWFREWERKTVTVFRRHAEFRWSIFDPDDEFGDGMTYSPSSFGDVEAAKTALFERLECGW